MLHFAQLIEHSVTEEAGEPEQPDLFSGREAGQ